MNNKEPPKPMVQPSVYGPDHIVYMMFYDPVSKEGTAAHIATKDVELLIKKLSEYLEKTKKG